MNYLQNLLDDVVDDKEDKDALAHHHKIVIARDITDQLDRAEVPRWDGATGGWELDQQSACKAQINSGPLRYVSQDVTITCR